LCSAYDTRSTPSRITRGLPIPKLIRRGGTWVDVGLAEALVFWFWVFVKGFVAVNTVGIVLVSLFPVLGRTGGLPYSRRRRR
jgi:hypothetical protein